MESIACPRCQSELEEIELAGATVDRCGSGCGLLVRQNKLIPLMDGLTKATGDSIDPDAPIEAVADHNDAAGCPDCSKPMDRFGYMESRLVTLDRCRDCWQVWIDMNELETMVRLSARTNGRAAAQEAEREELARHLSAMVAAGSGSDFASGGGTPWM